jgi:hypothetical protein
MIWTILRSCFPGIEMNTLIVLTAFCCDSEHVSQRISSCFFLNTIHFFLTLYTTRPNLTIFPFTFNRTALINYEKLRNSFGLTFLTTVFYETNTTLHWQHLPIFAYNSSNTVRPNFLTTLVGLDNPVLLLLTFSLRPKNSFPFEKNPQQSERRKHYLVITINRNRKTHLSEQKDFWQLALSAITQLYWFSSCSFFRH